MSTKQEIVKDERPSGLALPGGLNLPAAPDFMQQDGQLGAKEVMQKIQPPYLKIVQKQSGDELIAEHGIGAVLLVPDNILVIPAGGAPVRITPIFFYVEFLKLTSIKLKGSEPMIADRSLSPASELARKCADRNLWSEQHPKYAGQQDYNYRNAEALSFVCLFEDEHLRTGFPFILSFMKGSYGKGRQFCNQIGMRKRPIFGCVFELSVDPKLGQNSQGEWRRFLTANPPERPWVEDPAQYESNKALFQMMQEAHAKSNIVADYDSEEIAGEVVSGDSKVAAGSTGEY